MSSSCGGEGCDAAWESASKPAHAFAVAHWAGTWLVDRDSCEIWHTGCPSPQSSTIGFVDVLGNKCGRGRPERVSKQDWSISISLRAGAYKVISRHGTSYAIVGCGARKNPMLLSLRQPGSWQLAARLRDVEDDRNKLDSNRWGRSSASHGTTGIFRPLGHEELEDGER